MSHRSVASLLAASLLLLVTACASGTPEAAQPPAAPIRDLALASRAYAGAKNLPSHGVALEGYCPVAYHVAHRPLRGRPEFATTYDGATYYFVSAGAKESFDADPEKYVPAFGGWCAFGMSVQDKFPIDPESFEIVDGRLLVFLKNPGVDARDLWNQGDERELLARAESHWNSVSN